MAEIPESILRRSAEARAKAEGRSVEEVLAEMKGEAPPAQQAAPETPSPAAPAPSGGGGEAAKIPEALLRRTAEARAKAEGRTVDEVMAELKGEAPKAAAPAPAAAAPAGGGADLEAARAAGVPEHLLERAMKARAKAEGRSPEAPAAAAATPAPAGATAAATATAPAPAPAAPAIPEGVRTQRLLTVVKANAIQQVKKEPTDKVSTWPHLLAIEFVALLVVTAGLIVFSAFVNAPLLEFANFNEQPNPSKAPWYFLGLQELLSYFDPQVAGVIIPTMGLIGIAIIPFVDRNPSVRPSDRKLAIMIFTFFVMSAAILTIIGSFFRGPGFNFTFPWSDGLFFDF
jgi:menaquinol-cytochrome c reductase cytochrome b/c subunit